MSERAQHDEQGGDHPEQRVFDQRNALYTACQRTLGRLDALDPFGDGLPVEYAAIMEVRQWLAAEVDRVLPPGDAIVEEVA